ncbi:beta carbonic anhydrase 5, chloroplastic-like isoform X1 [Chenopodium quinoa]|uniref:beta carbonic anhydrase 5, chloroplastic-like isoform X1 n=1 Tax=Chenopodium quinoa TaxID=63459 RepID=UPI000B77AE54|nr:beta carbonic anhydrase 5, chloroplastic-like isoform X1 [Chenopodium quinoa]
MASLRSLSLSSSLDFPNNSTIFGSTLKLGENELTLLRLSTHSSKINPVLRLKASRISLELTKEAGNIKENMSEETLNGRDPFCTMKQRFLTFKKEKYLGNIEHYQNLAETQSPKFTVIACADSRVCPSNILGFQPGEAFTVRNVANLVPPFETGPSETKAALEFSVNALEVENILVVGHSRCGGIRALMSMEDVEEEDSRSFIKSWVIFGKNARVSTKSVASNLHLDQQCRHCEKESINHSLMNLLTYPWIKERVAKGTLSLHGGYYNFVDGTFEKWTLDYNYNVEDGHTCSVKSREFWS